MFGLHVLFMVVMVIQVSFCKVRQDVVDFYTNAYQPHVDDCLQKSTVTKNDLQVIYDTAEVPETEIFCSFLNCLHQKTNVMDSVGNIDASVLYFDDIPYVTREMVAECVKEANTVTAISKKSYLLFKCFINLLNV
ncbi:hypothetical protein FQR65_LT11347 [Abscondita terminalis]|nr:hypothetical protein FQR65_LT11347 [Abscondita terminalis]